MNNLTLKQETFCQKYIETGGKASEAYRQAYDAENMSGPAVNEEAYRLRKNPDVALRILQLQEEHAERHNVTVDSLTRELMEDRALAYKVENPSAAIAATLGKAKLHGKITDKQDHTGTLSLTVATGVPKPA